MPFWDSSAIVPLCCWQPGTSESRRLRRETGRIIVWWGTTVESRSALARLAKDGHLTTAAHRQTITRLSQLRLAWDEILPSEKVRSLAEELPDRYGVRAADAFQLAAALVWAREQPRQRAFVAFDERLRAAAATLGFSVRP